MTPEEREGLAIDQLIPSPVPSAYRLLDPDECEWRGRACIVLWLTGFSGVSAWRYALSRDRDWMAYMRDELPLLVPTSLAVDVLRKRLTIAQARQ